MKLSLTLATAAAAALMLPLAVVAKGGPPDKTEKTPTEEGPDLSGIEDASHCRDDAIYSFKCANDIFICGVGESQAEQDAFFDDGLCATSKQTGDLAWFDSADWTAMTEFTSYADYCADAIAHMRANPTDGNYKCPNNRGMSHWVCHSPIDDTVENGCGQIVKFQTEGTFAETCGSTTCEETSSPEELSGTDSPSGPTNNIVAATDSPTATPFDCS
ncbi:MAG: hypothetical protein SGARI_006906, partial [Bacillariaceae sp.]